ncbi:MAG: hypothetical protein AB1925_30335 [Actinomycetota bacterium]
MALPGATATQNVVRGWDVTDVAVSGSNIYAAVVNDTAAAIGTVAVGEWALARSTNGGATWAITDLGLAAATWIVDIVPSPREVNTVYVAVSDGLGTDVTPPTGVNRIMVSTNGGAAFTRVYTLPSDLNIISMDVTYYGTAHLTMIGTDANVLAAAGDARSVLLLDEAPAIPTWTNQGDTTATWTGVVSAGKFSTDFANDRMMTVVADNGVDVLITQRAGAGAWGAGVAIAGSGLPVLVAPVPGAGIAFPGDFNRTGNNIFYVNLNTGTGAVTDDVYEIDYLAANALDLNCGGAGTATPVASIAVSGSAGAARIIAGVDAAAPAAAAVVRRSSDSGGTWAAAAKAPSGGAGATGATAFVANGTDGTTVYAGTTGESPFAAPGTPDGASSDESAFSISTDSGANFNQRSLIDTDINTIDGVVIAGTGTDLFMVTSSAAGAVPMSSLWRTSSPTTGGDWWRVFLRQNDVAGGTMPWMVAGASPTYDADGSIWVAIDDPTLLATAPDILAWYSSNRGDSFTATLNRITLDSAGAATLGDVQAMAVASPTSVFLGDIFGDVIRTANRGRNWYPVATGAVPVVSMALAPGSATNLLVGGAAADVWESTDGAQTFAALGGALTGGNVYVAYDPNTATNSLRYAGDAAGDFFRYSSAAVGWQNIANDTQDFDADLVTAETIAAAGAGLITGIAAQAGPSGLPATLYAADFVAGAGVWRSINPDTTTAANVFLEYTGVAANPTAASTLGDDGTAIAARQGLWTQQTAGTNRVWALDTSGGPAAEVLYTYTDNLIIQPTVNAPTNVTQTAFTLNWNAMTGATSYDVQFRIKGAGVGFAAAAASPNVNTFCILTAATDAIAAGTTYEYRIRATTPDDSYWSATGELTTQLGARPWNPGMNPAGNISVSPAPGATASTLRPIFQWNGATGATGYELKVSTSADMSVLLIDLTGGAALGAGQTAYQVPAASPLTDGATYYWQVRAAMGTTQYSPWSDVFAFTVAIPVTQPPVTIPPQSTPTFILPTPTYSVPPATTITITQPPATTITIPPTPTPPTPSWVWVIIAIGGVLLIVVVVLIARTRKV